jgi:hypothetical protein
VAVSMAEVDSSKDASIKEESSTDSSGSMGVNEVGMAVSS